MDGSKPAERQPWIFRCERYPQLQVRKGAEQSWMRFKDGAFVTHDAAEAELLLAMAENETMIRCECWPDRPAPAPIFAPPRAKRPTATV